MDTAPQQRRRGGRDGARRAWLAAVVAAGCAAAALKLYLALTTDGSADVPSYADHLAKIRQLGVGVYHTRGPFNNPFNSPPFVIHALRALGSLERATGIGFPFWLRLPAILADAASLALVWKLLARKPTAQDSTTNPQRDSTENSPHTENSPQDSATNPPQETTANASRDWTENSSLNSPQDSSQRASQNLSRRPSQDGARLSSWREGLPLVLLALCPVSVMVSGYHGSVDPVMIFFVLASVYVTERRGRLSLAGALLGVALGFKVAALIFAPALFFYLPGARARLRFFAAAAAVFAAGSLPFALSEPVTIARSVFGYGSLYGQWGWTVLAAMWHPEPPRYLNPPHDVTGVHATFAAVGKWASMLCVVAVSYWVNRRRNDRPPLALQCGLSAALFLFLAPGFGIQYLAWLVPWVALAGPWPTLLCYATAGLYQLVGYTCWAERAAPPAYCARPALHAMLLCWASLLPLALTMRKNNRQS